jgi:hypothetical protein
MAEHPEMAIGNNEAVGAWIISSKTGCIGGRLRCGLFRRHWRFAWG